MNQKITKEMKSLAESQIRKMQKEISFDTKDYPIEVLVANFKEGEFYIPEYQRNFIWNESRKNRFIESVLLGLPIPFMFFSDNEDGRYEIIDGAQRTSTLEEFLNDDLELNDLQKLSSLNGFKFKDLPDFFQRKFKRNSLRIIVLGEETTIESKQDIFNRINTGGVEAVSSEIRRGTHVGPFMDLISELAKEKLFADLCPISDTLKKRHEDAELVLRFFAFLNNYKQFVHSVKDFLDEFVENNKDNFNEKLFRDEFEGMLNFVKKYFQFGFRKTMKAKSTPRVRFEAIAVGVALALREKPDLIPKSMDWLNSPEFKKHTTTHASNSLTRVMGRIEFVRDELLKG